MIPLKQRVSYNDESIFFQKVDRILSGMSNIKVFDIEDTKRCGSGSIAFTNTATKEIFLNFAKIEKESILVDGDDKIKFIGLCKGFNYHELAHILYTRRSAKVKWRDDLLQISNALEDGKIERLFSEEYFKAKKYFENCVLKLLWAYRKQLSPEMFLAIYSRKGIVEDKIIFYFQKLFAKAFGNEVCEKVKPLIDAYIGETDIEKQYAIVEKIAELLGHNNYFNSNNLLPLISQLISKAVKNMPKELIEKIKGMGCGCGITITLTDEDKKQIEKEQKEIEDLKKQIKELDDEIQKLRDKLWNDTKLSDAEKQKLSKEINKKQNLQRELEKKLEELMQNADSGLRVMLSGIEDKVKDLGKDIDTEVSKDLRTIYGGGCGSGGGSEISGTPLCVSPEHKELSNKLKNILKVIKNDLKHGYIPNRKSGKVNLRKSMAWNKTGNTRIFKKYIPNKLDKARLGVIALIDSSGSMHDSQFKDALACSWVLSNALEQIGNKVCIIEYSCGHKVIKDFGKKGDFKRHFHDGTNPLSALVEATQKIQEQGDIKNWLLFILTDGRWNSERECDSLISTMGKSGKVDTIMIHFGRDSDASDIHGCKHFVNIDDINKLTEIFKRCVKKVQRNIITQLQKEA